LNPRIKKEKRKKFNQKYIKKNNCSEKRMSERPENGQKLFEEIQNTKNEI
jgi:hypothetical protein